MFKYVTSAAANPPALPRVPHSLEDWKGELFWKAMDPIDSSYLCRILRHRKPEDIQLIFSEVKDQICALMLNGIGSSLIICLCGVCDEQQMNQMVSSLTADAHILMLVCLNSHGTPKQMYDVISTLLPFMARLVKHQFGYRVIGHFVRIFPKHAKETQSILDAIADIFFEMATDRYGHLLLGELLYSEVFLLESRPSILSKLIADVHELSYDTYGCCVVRDVIELGTHDVHREIVAQLNGDFAQMSMHKDAESVVSALMMKSKEELAAQIYNEIIRSPNFSRVLVDPFGKCLLEEAQTRFKETGRNILPLPDHHEGTVRPKKKKKEKIEDACMIIEKYGFILFVCFCVSYALYLYFVVF
ncbi:pumilio homolog 12-like isoform X2 [Primulina eburnea]|uniref:pumilio homolog 12-like isoform X2 n=1 Tax=Primulina eburnea TaxID=1245227 RepID=UPI003C6BD9CE